MGYLNVILQRSPWANSVWKTNTAASSVLREAGGEETRRALSFYGSNTKCISVVCLCKKQAVQICSINVTDIYALCNAVIPE